MSYTCNLENALIVGASTISIGLLSSGLLLTINENQIEYSRQKHNLKLKKYDRVEIDLLQYNIDLNDATQNEKQYSVLHNTIAGSVITCFLYLAFVACKKIH